MVKKLGITLVLVAAIAGNVVGQAKNGGIARQIAMGGSQASSGLVLNPFIMEDPALLLLNPAYQGMYSDYAWINVGGGTLNNLSTGNNGYTQQNAGVAFAFNREWAFGVTLSYDPSAVNVVNGLISGGGVGLPGFGINQRPAQNIPAVANVWEVLASYRMGSTMTLGFGFTYGSSKFDTTFSATGGVSGERLASSSMFGFRAGTVVDLGSGSSFDVSAAFRMDKATDNITSSAGSGGEYSASGTEIQIQARGKFKMSNRFSFVPYGALGILSAEPKEDAFPAGGAAQTLSNKVSGLAYAFGVGGEYRTSRFYLAGGVSYQSAQMKGEASDTAPAGSATYTATLSGLPVFNLGSEFWIIDWLAGRVGYYRSMASFKIKTEQSGGGVTATGESIRSFPNSFMFVGGINNTTHDGLVTLGLGLRFGGFALDATVSEEALRRGLGLIGSQDNINTFGYITTSYNFGE